MAHRTHPEQKELTLTHSILTEFINDVESRDFRTETDTGANFNALYIWNHVRQLAGLPRLRKEDLAAYCVDCDKYHVNPHRRKEKESQP